MIRNIFQIKSSLSIVVIFTLMSFFVIPHLQGSKEIFLMFNFGWLAVLYTALYVSRTYTYFFTSLLLFLGIWLKFVTSTIFNVPLLEPLGYWYGINSPDAWDHVLLVGFIVSVALLSVNISLFLIKNIVTPQASSRAQRGIQLMLLINKVPAWYISNRQVAWNIIIFVSLAMNLINAIGKVYVTGIIPQWILPFHLNLIIVWLLLFFVILSVATFLGWDQFLGIENRKKAYYLLLILAFITSVTSLSRFIFLFWTLPYLVLVIKANSKVKNLWSVILGNKFFILFYCVLLAASLIIVSGLRSYYYSTNAYSTNQIITSIPKNPTNNTSNSVIQTQNLTSSSLPTTTVSLEESHTPKFLQRILNNKEPFYQLKNLMVGRWIGLEAIMATTAYPNSGFKLFWKGLTEKPKHDQIGLYSSEILIKYKHAPNRIYSSLPGLVGILNYSHSFWIIFFGVFIVILFLSLIEISFYTFLKNDFFNVQLALLLSYFCVSSLNIPYLGMINLLEYVFVVPVLLSLSIFYKYIKKFNSRVSVT